MYMYFEFDYITGIPNAVFKIRVILYISLRITAYWRKFFFNQVIMILLFSIILFIISKCIEQNIPVFISFNISNPFQVVIVLIICFINIEWELTEQASVTDCLSLRILQDLCNPELSFTYRMIFTVAIIEMPFRFWYYSAAGQNPASTVFLGHFWCTWRKEKSCNIYQTDSPCHTREIECNLLEDTFFNWGILLFVFRMILVIPHGNSSSIIMITMIIIVIIIWTIRIINVGM